MLLCTSAGKHDVGRSVACCVLVFLRSFLGAQVCDVDGQVPVIQILLGQTGLVTSKQMLDQWRFVIVGATIAAAVLTPSTDPFTQTLLAVPLIGLYLGGAAFVKLIERQREQEQAQGA